MDELTEAKKIMRMLLDNGFECYICGGYVRDFLLNKKALDVDLVTNAMPDEIEALFDDVDTVGKSFLVSIVNGIDVATYRSESTNSVDTFVEPVKTLFLDVSRRDLTCNAMAMDIDGNIIDYFNGQEDIKNGIIRLVGDPEDRLISDPCRLLRACRFVSALDTGDVVARFAPSTFKAIKDNAHLALGVAPERAHKEFMKVMSSADTPSIFINQLYTTGLLKWILPELHDCYFFSGGNWHSEMVHEHLLMAMDEIPKQFPLLRLASLFHDIGKPSVYCEETCRFLNHEIAGAEIAQEVLQRLKFSTAEIKYIVPLIRLHMTDINPLLGPKSIRKVLHKLKIADVAWDDFLRLRWADRAANIRRDAYGDNEKAAMTFAFHEVYTDPTTVLTRSDLCVNGNDMLELGITGKLIAEVLDNLVKVCISRPEDNVRDRLLGCAKGFAKQRMKESK